MRLPRRRPEAGLLELEDAERRLQPMARYHLGIRAIPLDHVVGTEGRAAAFTRDFRPRHSFSRDRLRSLEAAFPNGGFPPIVAVKLGDTYFVIDGHHRVAFARRQGGQEIDADVTEFVARVPLPPGADRVELILAELERVFLEDSGLAAAKPGLRVSASRPAIYLELLENLQVHGYHLMRRHGRVLEPADVAADWYETIYAPVMRAFDRERLGAPFRDVPEADLFLMAHRHRRDAFPSCGCPPLETTVSEMVAGADVKTRRIRFLGRR